MLMHVIKVIHNFNLPPGGHGIYNFSLPFLGHHYHARCLIYAQQKRRSFERNDAILPVDDLHGHTLEQVHQPVVS